MIKPTQSVPDLSGEPVGGDTWRLSDQSPESFTVIEFYRGYHCPRCKVQLLDLDQKLARFTERGCSVIAISMDGQDRAEKTKPEWGLGELTLGYGLSEDSARQWGLFISTSIRDTETDRFNEPQKQLN